MRDCSKYKCKYYIKKDNDKHNAFNYIAGNKNGVCGYAEVVNPIEYIADKDCYMEENR